MSASDRKEKLAQATVRELMNYKKVTIENLDKELEKIKELKAELKKCSVELDKLIGAKHNKKRSLRRINAELNQRDEEIKKFTS